MNQHEKECMAYLNSHASTWCPVDALTFDPSEDIEKGSFVCYTSKDKRFITFPYYRELEEKTAKKVVSRMGRIVIDPLKVAKIITEYEKRESQITGKPFYLSEEQKEGVITLLSNRFAILTGGPGTGKTSVIKCVVFVIRELNPLSIVQLAAPTGKAARRMTEATSYPAVTIQSYIGDAGIGTKTLNQVAPDYLFVDETSFLDMETFYNLLISLKNTTKLFLIGDVDQLPSVGIGAVLRDLIDSRMIPCCHLEQTFRQDTSSVLSANIQIVKKRCYIPLYEGPDFRRIKTEKNALENILSEYKHGVDKYGVDEVAVICPYRKSGKICSEKLNDIIQRIMNPNALKKDHITANIERDNRIISITFAEGDPVMQLQNTRVANGDVGKVVQVENKKVTVEFYDCTIDYSYNMLHQLDLAYSMSVHKSQGSEYKSVILPLFQEYRNLDRNLIYTGITRAKKECSVIGTDKVIQDACKIQSSWTRYTFFCETLRTYLVKARLLANLDLLN